MSKFEFLVQSLAFGLMLAVLTWYAVAVFRGMRRVAYETEQELAAINQRRPE